MKKIILASLLATAMASSAFAGSSTDTTSPLSVLLGGKTSVTTFQFVLDQGQAQAQAQVKAARQAQVASAIQSYIESTLNAKVVSAQTQASSITVQEVVISNVKQHVFCANNNGKGASQVVVLSCAANKADAIQAAQHIYMANNWTPTAPTMPTAPTKPVPATQLQ